MILGQPILIDEQTHLAVVTLVAAVLLGACATSTPLISDEERCLRFGGHWEVSWCRHDGGGM